MSATITLQPRAWVGCLACYNSGRLVGEWLDADELEDADSLAAICTQPEHEELWVFDQECLAAGGEMSPAEAATRARAVATVLEQANEYGIPDEVAYEWLETVHQFDPPDSWGSIEDALGGSVESQADYVYELIEDVYQLELPPWLHIDVESTYNDLTMDYTEIHHNGSTYLFRSQ